MTRQNCPTTHLSLKKKDTRNTFNGPLKQGKSSERGYTLHSVSRRVFINTFRITQWTELSCSHLQVTTLVPDVKLSYYRAEEALRNPGRGSQNF